MSLSIQSNAASLSIQNQLNRTNSALSTALERLGSGYRINSAKDDAAGLQIANRLNAQATGQKAAIYNANNAQSMMQTAEGAFDEMTNIANRMKELATQAANGTNSSSEYTAMDAEYQALGKEMQSIIANTSFGAGTKLLDTTTGKFGSGAVTFQIGASTSETLAVDVSTQIGAIDTAIGTGGTYAGQALAWDTDAATTQTNAQTAMTEIDTLIDNIGSARSALGASMNRMDHSINNVTNMKENTEAAASNLMDADYAAETSAMTKQQLLMNSGVSVLSVSNSTTSMIASLLRG
ncbi:flagellin [Shewanella fodinae]|jgi:flagellin|uniref:flagellin N-terminal helical domain-containing protein n=1 Tax=Shewanella fodinae TaxID=552357 RepID=UPI001672EB25|nr:flagellin [Shewanella fodinae]MCL2908010.1 Lateral flagellin [Shewanella fodinae]GGZ12716.1 lateral flagellin [Shewanella fodinae]